MRRSTLSGLLLALLALAGPAHAGLRFFANRAMFDEAFPDARLEDFEEAAVAPGRSAPTTAPLRSATDDGVFAAGDIERGFEISDTPGPGPAPNDGLRVAGEGFRGLPSKAVGPVRGSDGLRIVFPGEGVPAFAFDLFNLEGGLINATIFGSRGEQIASRAFLASVAAPGFLSISSDDSTITRIDLEAINDRSELVDNIAFVPEPGVAALLTSALLLGLASRRRRRAGARGRLLGSCSIRSPARVISEAAHTTNPEDPCAAVEQTGCPAASA